MLFKIVGYIFFVKIPYNNEYPVYNLLGPSVMLQKYKT